ncbi:hypothetical protein FZC33_00675 [Labrys sp. KNU-23]|uniref:hypothetical protein n=1 Tax=Labrys sp. KNU-23 TaxID=2789216 RepID=UPI0011EC29B4|nr:hypothetical protein [Labrys sp. KNU-23]QEN84833.1 hypothetical protein FZC33_00675 [Labrys sp. KNU-23]
MKIKESFSEKRTAYLLGRKLFDTGKPAPERPLDSDGEPFLYWTWYGFQMSNLLKGPETTRGFYLKNGRRLNR